MLQTRKMYGDFITREHAQATADEEQRPVAVYWAIYESVRIEWRLKFRVRPTYHTIEDVKKRNKAAGQRWFEPDTMRFFSSRVQERIYVAKDGRAFFVSSERYGDRTRRLYTVRVANIDGSIDTHGDFQWYETGRAAHAAARKAAQS